jgi:hypothetical protein
MKRLLVVALASAALLAVRATGADAPPCRYAFPGNGTVVDTKTGLTWEQSEGFPSPPLDWPTAKAFCANLNLGGRSGWRLPTLKELFTLFDPTVDTTAPAFAVDPHAFGSPIASTFWSSTLVPGTTMVWVERWDGSNFTLDTATYDNMGVRCVR